jgi:hypothetical protein
VNNTGLRAGCGPLTPAEIVALEEGALIDGSSRNLVWGITPLINFLAAAPQTIDFDLPISPTAKIAGFAGRLVAVTRVGTATGTMLFTVGTNAGSADNFAVTTTISVALINALKTVAGDVAALSGSNFVPAIATPLQMRISQVPTGVTEFTGYLLYSVAYLIPPT